MESEVRLLEEEYSKQEGQKQSSGLSKQNFDLAMELSNEDKIQQNIPYWEDVSSNSGEFISTEYLGSDDKELGIEESKHSKPRICELVDANITIHEVVSEDDSWPF